MLGTTPNEALARLTNLETPIEFQLLRESMDRTEKRWLKTGVLVGVEDWQYKWNLYVAAQKIAGGRS